jgi:hypothetical protein
MKHYIGDGAFVAFDGYALELTTSNGLEDTNRIVLEPAVYSELLRYVAALQTAALPSGVEQESK